MAGKKLDQLCRSVLPAGFRQTSELGARVQKFLQENLPENVRQQATLLKASESEIVIAASSPLVANFLRMHVNEIQQQLLEALGLQQAIKFVTVPDSMLKVNLPYQPEKPKQVSANAVDSITTNAEWVEDEDLRAALLSLAQSLKRPG